MVLWDGTAGQESAFYLYLAIGSYSPGSVKLIWLLEYSELTLACMEEGVEVPPIHISILPSIWSWSQSLDPSIPNKVGSNIHLQETIKQTIIVEIRKSRLFQCEHIEKGGEIGVTTSLQVRLWGPEIRQEVQGRKQASLSPAGQSMAPPTVLSRLQSLGRVCSLFKLCYISF